VWLETGWSSVLPFRPLFRVSCLTPWHIHLFLPRRLGLLHTWVLLPPESAAHLCWDRTWSCRHLASLVPWVVLQVYRDPRRC
jgi:hypothetical protein